MKKDDKQSTEEIDEEISLPLDMSMTSDDEDDIQKKNKALTKQNDLDHTKTNTLSKCNWD